MSFTCPIRELWWAYIDWADLKNCLPPGCTSLQWNITNKERRMGVSSLNSYEDAAITRSGRGGELVVLKTSHLQELCLDNLSISDMYKKLENDPIWRHPETRNITRGKIRYPLRLLTNFIQRSERRTHNSQETRVLCGVKMTPANIKDQTDSVSLWGNLPQTPLAPSIGFDINGLIKWFETVNR